jgi:hypothetical protein
MKNKERRKEGKKNIFYFPKVVEEYRKLKTCIKTL